MYSFCHSDYLAIRTAPEILQLTFDSDVPIDYYQILERTVSNFFDTENTLLFPDGYFAMVAMIRNLIRDTDTILVVSDGYGAISDSLEIIQRQAPNAIIKSLTAHSFEELSPRTSRVVLLAAGVSETTCQIAPVDKWSESLTELWEKRRIPSVLLLDDSHGVGLLGPNHRGTLDFFGLPANQFPTDVGVQYYFSGSFSEAFGSYGGLLAGERKWLRGIRKTEPSCCRHQIPISTLVATTKAMELAGNERRHEQLMQNIQYLHQIFKRYRIPFTGNPALPFILVKSPQPQELIQVLEYAGFRIGLTRFTKKPQLRIVINPNHSALEIEQLAKKLVEEMENLKNS